MNPRFEVTGGKEGLARKAQRGLPSPHGVPEQYAVRQVTEALAVYQGV